ncbi:hypothetical protein ISN44_As11g018490 [Arabidopsis suecica]|uniref:Uncharacterized protein n=1 Tax=Arabidopsis suecica TaxID=45249 RepID=A0A8T1ZBX2_ARASU|nr:hypothetical protein ISN44_As11g018490 [Arabidopsis suecica]
MDVSCYIMVEETADSDTSFDFCDECSFSYHQDHDDNDAESSNCNTGDISKDLEANWDDDLLAPLLAKEQEASISDVRVDFTAAEEEDEEVEEEGKKWWSKEMMMMMVMEDKLFWEMCIAFGYP